MPDWRWKQSIVIFHPAFIPLIESDGWSLESVPDVMAAVSAADCVVIITNHSEYDYPAILDKANLIVDTRNALGLESRKNAKVERL